jgi:uncharacterized protein
MWQPGQALTQIIDSVEFARRHRRLAGVLELAALTRLADVLLDTGGHVRFELWGEWAPEEEAFLCLEIDAVLHLRCQRCLRALEHPLRTRSRLMLVLPGQDWPDEALEDDSFDPIEADRQLDVASLVEDEILLGLPQAPRHERCEMAKAAGNGETVTPFAVLASLKADRK